VQARLIALACLVVDVVGFLVVTPHLAIGLRVVTVAGIVLVDAALSLPARYSAQLAVAHCLAAVGLALVLRNVPGADWNLAGGLIAAYRVGAWLKRRSSVASLVALALGVVVGTWLVTHSAVSTLLTPMENALIPWLVGRYTSSRRGFIEELRHNRELEVRDARAETERAANRLQTSIARDLHDVIAHHISAIGVHAGAVRLKLSAQPECADQDIIDSLSAVETSSRAAMVELRRLLDLLHGRPQLSANQPGLHNLNELFNGVRRSGLAIRFQADGTPPGLPDSIDTALYRVAQEMLTNAQRHGDGTPVDVRLVFAADVVTLSARNSIGRKPASEMSIGRGLAGIRSRVGLYGGSFTCGPIDDNTWETSVSIGTTPEEAPCQYAS